MNLTKEAALHNSSNPNLANLESHEVESHQLDFKLTNFTQPTVQPTPAPINILDPFNIKKNSSDKTLPAKPKESYTLKIKDLSSPLLSEAKTIPEKPFDITEDNLADNETTSQNVTFPINVKT